jgi:hypothetical protein
MHGRPELTWRPQPLELSAPSRSLSLLLKVRGLSDLSARRGQRVEFETLAKTPPTVTSLAMSTKSVSQFQAHSTTTTAIWSKIIQQNVNRTAAPSLFAVVALLAELISGLSDRQAPK